MTDINLSTAFNLTPSLLENLSKALIELESHKNSATDSVSFTEISSHFRDLESKLMEKYAELEAREKAFKQEESDNRLLLAAKEAAVAEKEQDMFDRIQVLKDAAVAAIVETRANHLSPSVYTNDLMDPTENKVSCSLDVTDAVFHQELTQFCQQMDTKGLLTFVMKNRKNITVLCEELSHALKFSSEPGRLILDSLKGFYPSNEVNNNDKFALRGMRQSCINIMEAMNAMLARADMNTSYVISLEVKQQAKAIADEWSPKLAQDSYDAKDGKSLEVEAFLQLISTFRIASEFDEDELCKLVFEVCERRQAPQLCRSLGLAHKMPGVIKELISKGKVISAVHFVHAFELVERFPTVSLLKTYLKDLRRNSQGKRGNSPNSETAQNEGNAAELAALRAIIQCVQKYNLEADYPLDPLQKRVGQLERAKTDKKRSRDSNTKLHNKKPRSNGGPVHKYRSPAAASLAVNGRQAAPPPPPPVYIDRGPYAATSSERYPYNYQAAPPPTQTMYSQQVYEQNAYYYPQDNRAAAATLPPAYGGYTSVSVPALYRQPYM